jgi:hypothetical protein
VLLAKLQGARIDFYARAPAAPAAPPDPPAE